MLLQQWLNLLLLVELDLNNQTVMNTPSRRTKTMGKETRAHTKDEDPLPVQRDHLNKDRNCTSVITVGDGDIAIDNVQVWGGAQVEDLKWG